MPAVPTLAEVAATLRTLADSIDPPVAPNPVPVVAVNPPATMPPMPPAMPPMPMARMPDMDRVLALVPTAKATCTAKQSGLWSVPATWGGVLPKADDTVLVPAGVSVSQDVDSPKLNRLRVDGTISPSVGAKCTLWAGLIVTTESGQFAAGENDANPFTGQWNIKIADYGPIDTATDPFALDRGLITLGAVGVYGRSRAGRIFLAADASKGATSLTLKTAATGWNVGDRIAIAGQDYRPEPVAYGDDAVLFPNYEVRSVASISLDFLTIGLDAPLIYDHTLTTRWNTPRAMYCANVSPHSVHVFSENVALPNRGHVMHMRSDMTVPIGTHYMSFFDLGRTDTTQPRTDPDGLGSGLKNPRGRYAHHYHMCGTSMAAAQPDSVGCVIVGSPGWGDVAHSSSPDRDGLVVMDCVGCGIVGEKGDEGNCICDPTVIGTNCPVNVTISDDNGGQKNGEWFGTGVGIGIMGGGIRLEGTVVVSGCQVGIERQGLPFNSQAPHLDSPLFDVANLPAEFMALVPKGVTQLNPCDVPFVDTGIIAFGNQCSAEYWNINGNGTEVSVVCDSTFTGNVCEDAGGGIARGYMSGMTFRDSTLVCSNALYRKTFGLGHSGVNTRNKIVNMTILGYEVGIEGPTLYDNEITGCTIKAITGIRIMNATQRRRKLTLTNNTLVLFTDAELAALKKADSGRSHTYYDPSGVIVQREIVMRPSLGGTDIYASGLQNFLTGTSGIMEDDVLTLARPDGTTWFLFFQEFARNFPLNSYPNLPPELIGLNEGQMTDKFGVAVGGKTLPPDAVPLPGSLCYAGPTPATLLPYVKPPW